MVTNNYQSEPSRENKEPIPAGLWSGKECDAGFAEEFEIAAPGQVWGMRLPKGLWVRIAKTGTDRFHAAMTLSNNQEATLIASSGAELAAWMRELVERQPEVLVKAERRAVRRAGDLVRFGGALCGFRD
jgi:hypothetical protein